ncbi:HAD-superfamily hydrolase, subfamily IA, variant 1 [Roseobacter sp. AzwK-3b]|uniref:HAD family hydrolase n=1 Tax=Roseobacter sp. AzwK-3b TaxID=351016 RepID=UPI00015694A3|nr:HAD family hydrolase [Roseobacter sp. AzwK-3b]EDM71667.1 HAD-superfamily hydrolase, subfamily IA, variant 1 [Roseobacter sp. AzwK-3b]
MTTTASGIERKIDGILFDKDGTLFDFNATWNVWAQTTIHDLAGGEPAIMARIALEIDFDLENGRFNPKSPVIAGTNREAAECMGRALPERSIEEIEHLLMMSAADAPLAPAVPLAAFLEGLAAQGIALGVMTNDTEYGARSHLRSAGVEGHFDFIAGFDSGHGAKPAPGPLLAFARHVSLLPERVVMVGDSTHDLLAGRAAGMQTVGVLTGLAGHDDLAPLADAVLPDIGHLPAWMLA